MNIRDLDRQEYKSIPIYPLGSGDLFDTSIAVSKYDNHLRELSPLHRHEVIQINYISKGRLSHCINNMRYELVRGDIFVIPPFVPHQLVSIDSIEFEVVELEFQPEFVFGSAAEVRQAIESEQSVFDFSYIEPFLVSERNVRPCLNLSGKKQLEVESLLDDIMLESAQKNDGFLLAMKADLLKILVITGRAFKSEMKGTPEFQMFRHQRDAMAQALRYLDENFTEQIGIDEISRIALLSPSYFSYLFKVLTGKTLVEYLHNLRIKKAMELLKNTDRLVIDICYESGFNNINHFNRTFKGIVGISPTAYRVSGRKPSKKQR